MKTEILIEKSSFGNPEPTVYFHWSNEDKAPRMASAEVYSTAARIEMASLLAPKPWGEWVVVVRPGPGIIHLELMQGTEAEVAAAMKVLRMAV